MTNAHAIAINQAACAIWFFQNGITERIGLDVLAVVTNATVAQIRTASEIVEAINDDAMKVDGPKRLHFTLNPSAAAKLREYAVTQAGKLTSP